MPDISKSRIGKKIHDECKINVFFCNRADRVSYSALQVSLKKLALWTSGVVDKLFLHYPTQNICVRMDSVRYFSQKNNILQYIAQEDLRIQLYSIELAIKETCKDVKSCHSLIF